MTKDKSGILHALGQKVTEFAGFDTFQRPVGLVEAVMISEEFTALCPVTNQPDWYTVKITYQPKGLCLESKTLKLYLHSFRQDGMFCEALAATIASEICLTLDSCPVAVELTQRPRGGVAIVAKAHASAQILKERGMLK